VFIICGHQQNLLFVHHDWRGQHGKNGAIFIEIAKDLGVGDAFVRQTPLRLKRRTVLAEESQHFALDIEHS
jgi:hypothetical protein